MPQLSLVVALVTCSVIVSPELSVNDPVVAGEVPQDRVCVGAEPFTAQARPVGMLLVPASIDQLTPAPEGRASESVVPVESPGPALDRVTVKPMGLPALTETASWVLVRVSDGRLAVWVDRAVGEPSLVVVTVAVLS